MKKYDFKKVKKIISDNKKKLESASLGMHEDWFYTAETVWESGEYAKDLDNKTRIGGIDGSYWATPTLQLCFKDGSDKMIDVSVGESDDEKPDFLKMGVLSKPVQDNITPLSESKNKNS